MKAQSCLFEKNLLKQFDFLNFQEYTQTLFITEFVHYAPASEVTLLLELCTT